MDEFTEHHAYRRMFWREADGVRTSCTEADATSVEIETRNGQYRTSFSFAWPAEQLRAWELTNMLNVAFRFGKADARAGMRAALGL